MKHLTAALIVLVGIVFLALAKNSSSEVRSGSPAGSSCEVQANGSITDYDTCASGISCCCYGTNSASGGFTAFLAILYSLGGNTIPATSSDLCYCTPSCLVSYVETANAGTCPYYDLYGYK